MSYGNSKELAERLSARGFRSVKRNSGKGFMGLELKQGDAG